MENYDFFLQNERRLEEANPVIGKCLDCENEIRANEEAYLTNDNELICGSCMDLRIKEMERNFENYVSEKMEG